MKTIYIFRRVDTRDYGFGGRTSGWLNPNNWYNAGYVFGSILQFLAGVGIGWLIKIIFIALGIA